MTSQALEILKKEYLPFKLRSIFIGRIALVDRLNHPSYCYINNNFVQVLEANEIITSEFIGKYAQNVSSEIFIHIEDYDQLHIKLKNDLIKHSRSLSIGQPYKNAIKQVNLMSIQMGSLYKEPLNDELLTLQFQSSKNLSNLLLKNKAIHKQVYLNTIKQNHHFTIKQPMLSSILLLSFTQFSKIFSEKEIQQLFLTSYFKDFGMSFIPHDKYDSIKLTQRDKKILSTHSQGSVELLEGRVPLSKTNLNLIKNHHYINDIIQSKLLGKNQSNNNMILGVESLLISVMDVLVAMTNERPYRKSTSTFKALELIKKIMADDYSQEFKELVIYLKHFFSFK